MSYFSNNKLYHYYEVIDSNVSSDSIIKDTIEVLNNETIRFDFSKLNVYAPIYGVLNSVDVETIKIIVDWGDGTIDRLTKPLVSNSSTIGTYRPNQWKSIEHLFNVEKKYDYKTDDIQYLHKITITAYNTFNDKFVIQIPYKILYKTIYDLGSEMALFSANTTNTNKVSYTLKQKATDSMFVVNSLDWRTIYGDDDEVTIEESVSEVFSDEFVNEDFMVWDWKTAPTVEIYSTTDNIYKTIDCNFVVTGVMIDDWYPQMVLLQDKGNVTVTTQKAEDVAYSYSAVLNPSYADELDETNFKPGIYETYLSPLIGINGVTTRSDSKYINYNSLKRPRDIQQIKESDIITIRPDGINNDIRFNFTLPANCQLVAMTKAELILTAHLVEDDTPIEDVEFRYDILSPFLDKNGKPLYGGEEEDKKFSFVIKMRDIPNTIEVEYVEFDENNNTIVKSKDEPIYYRAFIETNDVLGGDDNTLMYDSQEINSINGEYGEVVNNITFDGYDIGNFTTQELSISPINQLDKTFTISWVFEKRDDWDQFIVALRDGSNYLINDVHNYFGDERFVGIEHDVTTHTFTKTFNANTIDDSILTADVSYRVNMGDFYDYRERKLTKEFTLTYPTPILEILDIQPYYTIHYDTLQGLQSLVLNAYINGHTEEELKNITLNIDDETPIIISDLQYMHKNIGFVNHDYKYYYKGANGDDTFNRLGQSDVMTLSVGDVSNLDILPNKGTDYMQGNSSQLYTIAEENDRKVDWLWVKQNTLHDIDKHYKWTLEDGKELFGGDKSGNFMFGDEQRHALFEVITLQRNAVSIRRFRPYIASGTLDITKREELNTVDQCFNSETTVSLSGYDKSIDKGLLTITWTPQETSKVKNMWLTLTNDDKEVETVDVMGYTNYTFKDLEFGTNYNYYITMNSEYTKNSDNIYQNENKVNVLINPIDSIEFAGRPTKSQASTNYTYLNWSWVLHHESCEDVKLFFYDKTGIEGEFKHIKLQSSIIPRSFPNTYTEEDVENRNVVTYGFKMKSASLDKSDYTEDADGYIIIHQGTIEL